MHQGSSIEQARLGPYPHEADILVRERVNK